MSVKRSLWFTVSVAASVAALLALVAPPVGANELATGDAYGDEYGNVVLHTEGGPKIIFVGGRAAKSDVLGREIRSEVPVYRRGKGPSVIYPVSDPPVVGVVPAPNTGCDSPFVIRGRGYMYGLDRNETPVIGHPGCE